MPSLSSPWQGDPLVAGLAAAGALCFLQGYVRLRRRGLSEHASPARAVLFFLGLGCLVLPVISPLDELGDRFLLSAHMLQHVLIGDAAPALILVSLRGPLLFFAIPKPLLRVLGHSAGARRLGRELSRPQVALGAWAAFFGGWHIPAAYDFAARHQPVHDLEHLSFVLAGFLVWSLLVDPARHGRLSRGRRLGVAVLLLAMGTAIADLLIFSLHPLYPAYAGQAHRVFGLSPLRDQRLAGLVMTVEQFLALGTFVAILVVPVLRGRRRAVSLPGGRPATPR